MALLATTKLEAVNMMLSAIGEAPVTTISDDTIEDAQMAVTTLDQVLREILSTGWHFNTDYDYVINVDGNSKLPYPTTAFHVDAMDYEWVDAVARHDGTGMFMYDRENHTFTWDNRTTLKCRVVWAFEFEEIPQSFRQWVALRAALRFAKQVMGDEATVQYSAQDEAVAKAYAVQDDARRADHNVLRDNWTSFNTLRNRSIWRA